MKARVLGRDVDVTWDHFLTVAAIIIAYALVSGLVVGGVAYLSDGKVLGPSYPYYSRLALDITGVFIQPLLAWLFLRFARGKNEDSKCLSLAGSAFLFESALQIATTILFLLLVRDLLNPGLVVSDAFGLMAGIAGAAAGSIILYGWMLFFIKRDDSRIKSSAVYGLVLALAYYALLYLAIFLIDYYQGRAYSPDIGLNDLVGFAGRVVLGSIILYHAGGRKIVWNDAVFYGGLYVAGAVFGLASSLILSAGEPSGGAVNGDALMLADRAVWLALLYLAVINWKDRL